MASYSPNQKRVAVLRGGPSSEYEVSLQTGAHVLSLLHDMPGEYYPMDIFISRDGAWHREGMVEEPHRALRHVDVVWNGLHGPYGEDGQVQRVLESMRIPFTGSGAMASALSMDKHFSKDFYKRHNLLTPRHELILEEVSPEHLLSIFRTYMHPVIVKPVNAGSSVGVRLAHSFHELEEAIQEALGHSKRVMVEEFIRGREATCGVVDDMRGESVYALLPVEIRKPAHKTFFDYEAKYSGESEELCPGNFSREEVAKLEEMAREAHKMLGLRHYSRSDFMLTPSGKIYILETNSLPGLTGESLLPKSIKAVGLRTHDFVDHVLKLALRQ